jgi:uncharacterized membrane protein HdeD (DUF308 family)
MTNNLTPPQKPILFPGLHAIKENWAWFLGLGLFLIVLGALAAGAAVYTTFLTVFFLGLLLAVGGITQLIYSFWTKDWSGFFYSLLSGLLYLIIGALFIFKPAQAAAALTLLIGALFAVSGLFKIIASIAVRMEHWGWVLFSGIISLILGVMILAEWPLSGLWIIGLFVGIDLMIYGWLSVLVSLTLKNIKE